MCPLSKVNYIHQCSMYSLSLRSDGMGLGVASMIIAFVLVQEITPQQKSHSTLHLIGNSNVRTIVRTISTSLSMNKSETTLYSDRLSIHYPPISDAFDNRVFFLHYTNDSTLTLLRNSLLNINKHCYKKHLKWGDEVMKKSFSDYTVLYDQIDQNAKHAGTFNTIIFKIFTFKGLRELKDH